MSTVYNLEPQPTAKVLLQTTSGDILVELFAKQTPLTSRNFLQLCLDGYYDDTLFHRLVPGFMIQGGDPTGTGEGGESIYDDGRPFADEFHSRLKFNRRGLLGMANGGKKDDNGSQFFFTLGKTEELNGKNTLFGRVVGDTIYNLMKMGEAELSGGEGSDRPLYPTRITGTEVLVNPFEGMTKREGVAMRTRTAVVVEQTKKVVKRKVKRTGKTLLSFGGEEANDDVDVEPVAKKPKYNTKLINAGQGMHDASIQERKSEDKGMTDVARVLQDTKKNKDDEGVTRRTGSSPRPEKAVQETQEQRPRLSAPRQPPSRSSSSSPDPPSPVAQVSSVLEQTNAQIAQLKASMKRSAITNTSTNSMPTTRKKSALEEMIPEKSIRGRKRRHQEGGHGGVGSGANADDKRALDMFNAFRRKLDQADHATSSATDSTAKTPRTSNNHQPPVPTQPTSSSEKKKKEQPQDQEDQEEENLCDLHFLAHCQSCRAWDSNNHHLGVLLPPPDPSSSTLGNPKQQQQQEEEDDINDTKWMSHTLRFEKDRRGGSRLRRGVGVAADGEEEEEDSLVVIDPREEREKEKEKLGGEKRKKNDIVR